MRSILSEAYDLHVHSGPSIFPRFEDDLGLVRQAAEFGMRSIVLKAHEGSTAERAALMNKVQSDVTVVGSVVLNHFVGGLNPHALEVALELGARVVWFPTIHSAGHLRHFGAPAYTSLPTKLQSSRPVAPLTLFDEEGKIVPSVYEIVDLVAQRDVVLATGHLDAREVHALVRLAKDRGVQRIVATHPDFATIRMSLDEQQQLCQLGAVVEKTALTHQPEWEGLPYEHFVEHLRRLDPSRVILSSDFGQMDSGPPYPGFAEFLTGLLAAGAPESVLEKAIRQTPAELLSGGN